MSYSTSGLTAPIDAALLPCFIKGCRVGHLFVTAAANTAAVTNKW
ncbi:hypothetical protein [Bacillus velezensis]|nr:hypothetical protein [Bacillus velezensis]